MLRKKRKESQTQGDKFHEVHCPRCGQFVKRVKKKKQIDKQHFECKCTQRFSLTFPGINESMEDWKKGDNNDWSTGRLR